MLLSSGIDLTIFFFEAPFLVSSFGGSLVVDEIIEFVISKLLARNKLDLKTRYKVAGVIPVPGITSLSLQAVIEMVRSYRKPEKILAKLNAPALEEQT